MATILVNFSENGNFGCDGTCKFCQWRALNYNKYYCPSDAELLSFHAKYPYGKWQISGGGDPLYHYEKNCDKLKHIAELGHQLGHKLQIVTRKISTILEHYEDLSTYIDGWNLSVSDVPTPEFIQLAQMVNSELVVSAVVNFTADEEINWSRIEAIYNNYSPYVNCIILRENFITGWDLAKRELFEQKVLAAYPKAKFSYDLKVPVLFNGEITDTQQVNLKYLQK